MGKSPGKWIKSIIFGKKTSKSGTSKDKPFSISAKEPASNLSTGLLSISEPLPVSVDEVKESSNFGKEEAAFDCGDEVAISSMKQDEVAPTASAPNLTLPEDTWKLEQAATKAQAAFRGYLARRAFQTLKGIIRLQSVIRGHLVKRQAVATLYCLQGIVKLQALVRGQIVRRSTIGSEIFSKKILGNEELGYFKSDTSSPVKEIVKNAFTEKLLSSLPTAMPLQIQYGPGEPNSVQEWLMRWTISQALGPDSKLEIVKTDQAMPKQSGRRMHSGKIENGTNHSNMESDKFKHNQKKMSNHSLKSVSEHQGNEIEKVRKSLKKTSKSILENSGQSEAVTDLSRQNLRKPSSTLVPELSGRDGKTPLKETTKLADAEILPERPSMEAIINEPCGVTVSETKPEPVADKEENIAVSEKDLDTNLDQNENGNINGHRRASLPAQHDIDTSMHIARKVPSYMAPTKSARAKVRELASPRFGQEVDEKNALTRRYSLPSSANGKLSSSPRVQRLVQASGKDGIKIDRSLSSSRDGSDKVIRAEWKR
ncbi:PREDICTED: protein IQ-DOMAIN 31-like [Ipomoea nil]|uniref:protein IQ-DOMAIN 31-like n=1 Tax=Ipomoea nil TaxID=35883 RepID=UPI00090151BA|nr:PREDICTED: protein IQ-DOMAIN 31-like [Ipomoea nil]XP_019150744.1 PREDICTED: protein IQ-DOMAIN 31-like [Ipomoea nil]XP_019150745.1 PREDICTED: protein IQ-DOMAIN 31-like [Ipomoea nil]XP_019150746.1 PREDICTED: protein IQ-DOMAIN 31-like [Ipomoea nil]XP_019150747.1 PREDICTED: protein IQ-DOMAIN 31-like [Ipomoea nil]